MFLPGKNRDGLAARAAAALDPHSEVYLEDLLHWLMFRQSAPAQTIRHANARLIRQAIVFLSTISQLCSSPHVLASETANYKDILPTSLDDPLKRFHEIYSVCVCYNCNM